MGNAVPLSNVLSVIFSKSRLAIKGVCEKRGEREKKTYLKKLKSFTQVCHNSLPDSTDNLPTKQPTTHFETKERKERGHTHTELTKISSSVLVNKIHMSILEVAILWPILHKLLLIWGNSWLLVTKIAFLQKERRRKEEASC